MGDEWPPTDWKKATRADWDRLAEESARYSVARDAKMSDEEKLKEIKEIEQEWDGPISMSPAHYYETMGIDPAEAPSVAATGSRASAISKLGSWIARKLRITKSSDFHSS